MPLRVRLIAAMVTLVAAVSRTRSGIGPRSRRAAWLPAGG